MCRIAGIVNFESSPSLQLIQRMRDTMRRGGPDDAGVYIDDTWPLAFGHRRLSFQDLSPLGHQPMMDDTGNIVLIFNGEIYNFPEIREELVQKKYHFKSKSDTEVIIYAYRQWGIECFKRFNGMFALALLDKRANKLILARDHAGIKPLYYFLDEKRIYFASEVRAFSSINAQWPENQDWKKYFLLFGHLPEPVTTLQNVKSMPKGTIFEIDLPSLKITEHKFFSIYYNYSIYDRREAISEVRALLINAVRRHLVSDAPIGLFLSGGLDSSLLTLIAKDFIPENLKTISVIFEDERYSEKYYQDIIIKKTNAHHQSYLVTERDFQDSLSDILEAMDQPSSDGINSYFVCKYARAYGLKTAFSGLGADELFGGYQSFNRTNVLNAFKWMPDFIYAAAGIFPDDRRKKVSFLSVRNGIGDYLFNRGFFIPSQIAELLDCSETEIWEVLDKVAANFPSFVEKLPLQEKVSYLETNLYMQNQLLKDTDYMSMWHGLEVRVPFLDKDLMSLTYSIHPEIRYNPTQLKYLLIEAFRSALPIEIWNRPKQGFTFPFEQWMAHVKQTDHSIPKLDAMKVQLMKGKLHWSRYWTYILSQQYAEKITVVA